MHHAAGYVSLYIYTDNSIICTRYVFSPFRVLFIMLCYHPVGLRSDCVCATRVECQTRTEAVQSVARRFKNVIRAIKRTAHQVFTPRTHIQQQHKRNPPLNDYKSILLLCIIYYNRHLYHVGRGRKPCTGIR